MARHKFAKLAGRKSRVGSTPTSSAKSDFVIRINLKYEKSDTYRCCCNSQTTKR